MLENRRKNKYLLITKKESVETEFKHDPNEYDRKYRKKTKKPDANILATEKANESNTLCRKPKIQ